MKSKLSNIALESICIGDVAGGLLLWTWESLQALLFMDTHGIGTYGRKGRPWSLPVDKPGRK
jgi:hypothetical protein